MFVAGVTLALQLERFVYLIRACNFYLFRENGNVLGLGKLRVIAIAAIKAGIMELGHLNAKCIYRNKGEIQIMLTFSIGLN